MVVVDDVGEKRGRGFFSVWEAGVKSEEGFGFPSKKFYFLPPYEGLVTVQYLSASH